ncbi:MAG: hypothetical protein LIP08_13765 [Bacteroides sp.]|nr:hypothetical protein [Bacteroides sp.]
MPSAFHFRVRFAPQGGGRSDTLRFLALGWNRTCLQHYRYIVNRIIDKGNTV